MDSSNHLRGIQNEELQTMETIKDPVNCPEDIPPWKLAAFRKVDKGVIRQERRKMAKKLGIDWSEYMVYRSLK